MLAASAPHPPVGYHEGMDGKEYEVPNNQYVGMTTNERLFAAKLLDQFDDSIRARDRELAASILQRVGLTRWHAEQVAETILANPKTYGY